MLYGAEKRRHERVVRNVPFDDLTVNPGFYKGELFNMRQRVHPRDVGFDGHAHRRPLRPRGCPSILFRHRALPGGRFFALLPRGRARATPWPIAATARQLAGVFTGTERVRVGKSARDVPIYEIEEIYLWPADTYLHLLLRGLPLPGSSSGSLLGGLRGAALVAPPLSSL